MLPSSLRSLAVALLATAAYAQTTPAEKPKPEAREWLPPAFAAYFRSRVTALEPASQRQPLRMRLVGNAAGTDWLDKVDAKNWPQVRAEMRTELQHMLGLDPWPERTPLQPVITGTVQGEGYRVEKVHFQSAPGLYVTGNLYLPADTSKPCPTILYVCGHSSQVKDKVSLGNKTGYQHHGAWFARHGYVCLLIDTIQLGEIRGEHAGTHRLNRWWWVARGYTPAGVEAWNSIRALDYLETRPEVDKTKFGITGRSGGGAYSWYTAALDERIRVVAPTAGITTMANHVLDGCIEGHCDCMFMVNSGRWEFDRLAALVAPRPLLISNTDKDTIFPFDGVVEIFRRTRKLYDQLGEPKKLGIQMAEGPHMDMQPLNTGAFHWMNRWLKGADPMDLTDEAARKRHEPVELRVFSELPKDERVTTVDEWFVPAALVPPPPADRAEWEQQRHAWVQALQRDCFGAFKLDAQGSGMTQTAEVVRDGLRWTTYELAAGSEFPLTLWTIAREQLRPEETEITVLNVLDDAGYEEFSQMAGTLFPPLPRSKGEPEGYGPERRMWAKQNWRMAYLAPRGVGAGGMAGLSEKKRIQVLRRFQLLGETLEAGQVRDIIRAAQVLNTSGAVWVQAERQMAANAVYAAIFGGAIKRLDLHQMPVSHRDGPIYLNILRYLDLPQAVAMAAEGTQVALYTNTPEDWTYASAVAKALSWGEKQLQLRKEMAASE